jgi:hypothetical protein
VLLGLSLLPLAVLIRDTTRERLDLIYYELTQFFIDELKNLLEHHRLNPEKYKFKVFSGDYFRIKTLKTPSGLFAVVEPSKEEGNH